MPIVNKGLTLFLAVILLEATVIATCLTGPILAADPTPQMGRIILDVVAEVILQLAVTQGAGPGVEIVLGMFVSHTCKVPISENISHIPHCRFPHFNLETNHFNAVSLSRMLRSVTKKTKKAAGKKSAAAVTKPKPAVSAFFQETYKERKLRLEKIATMREEKRLQEKQRVGEY